MFFQVLVLWERLELSVSPESKSGDFTNLPTRAIRFWYPRQGLNLRYARLELADSTIGLLGQKIGTPRRNRTDTLRVLSALTLTNWSSGAKWPS